MTDHYSHRRHNPPSWHRQRYEATDAEIKTPTEYSVNLRFHERPNAQRMLSQQLHQRLDVPNIPFDDPYPHPSKQTLCRSCVILAKCYSRGQQAQFHNNKQQGKTCDCDHAACEHVQIGGGDAAARNYQARGDESSG